jgi:hypothetical protein
MNKKPSLITAEQLALVLGVSEFTLKKLAKEKDLPCIYINRQPRFDYKILLKHFERLEGGVA